MLVAAVLFGAASIPAQVSDGSELQRFFEPIEVPLVNVDVHVTGADGRAVPGLVLADLDETDSAGESFDAAAALRPVRRNIHSRIRRKGRPAVAPQTI